MSLFKQWIIWRAWRKVYYQTFGIKSQLSFKDFKEAYNNGSL